MRIFIALDIDDEIRGRITRFMDGVREFAPEARWVRPESMHITLKFIGEKSGETVEEIKKALQEVRGPAMEIGFRGYGFFPTPRSARVFWVGIEAGPELPKLASAVDSTVAKLSIPKEDHPFSPHLTLARRGGRSGAPKRQKQDHPNPDFSRMQAKLSALPQPEFGTMTAREFYLYESKLGPGGSKYTKLERFALG
jgi:RNA 2',3'-cyclic 3'-phosphodiesterase